VNTLFVLAPDGPGAEALLLAAAPGPGGPEHRWRRYPPADDARHLQSLVRAGRDPQATRRWRGALLAIGSGAALGTLVNGVLGAGFGMFGGLLEIALPLGAGVGAFLGGFTAAMTGTERPREELRALWPHATRGCVLLQCDAAERGALAALRDEIAGRGLPVLLLADA
jgi:hypothetical protein